MMGVQELPAGVLSLSAVELRWLLQERERRLKSLELLLGGLSAEEHRRATDRVIRDCLKTLRKERLS